MAERSGTVLPGEAVPQATPKGGRPPRIRPTVVVVGRPNVGKSSLFNRLVGRRDAIVEDTPGVTRDRRVREVTWSGARFDLVDTGGWMPDAQGMWASVSRQVATAVATADLVLVVVDALVGVTDEDARLARFVARQGVSTLVVANKVDSAEREALAFNALSLGLGTPFALSALHGRGSGELLDAIVAALGEAAVEDPALGDPSLGDPSLGDPVSGDPATADLTQDGTAVGAGALSGDDWSRRPPAVAIVGRPNAGKSTLFNRLVGEERAVVSDVPGRRPTAWTRSSRRRKARSVSSTPPACAAGRASRMGRSATPLPGLFGPWTAQTSRCSSSTLPRASPTRTSGSPSGSTPQAARWWSC
jgi:GTP-binding protein